MQLICNQCNNPYSRSRLRPGRDKYCSRPCAARAAGLRSAVGNVERARARRQETPRTGDPSTRYLRLSGGGLTLVDANLYDNLKAYSWFLNRGGYAVTKPKSGIIQMHRLVVDAKAGQIVDHINGDALDNRRSNLRLATRAQNSFNSKLRSDNTSGYRGVQWSKQKLKWHTTIHYQGRTKHIGYFSDKEEAARAWNQAALERFGAFARLNVIR